MCKKCKRIIYAWNPVKGDSRGMPSPSDIIRMFNGKCPYCEKPLEKPKLDDIKIYRIYNELAIEKGRIAVEVL